MTESNEPESPSKPGDPASTETPPAADPPAEAATAAADPPAPEAAPEPPPAPEPPAETTPPALAQRIAALEAEKQENWERLLRTAADFDNYRKRARRETADAERRAIESVIRELLPIVDNLERALGHETPDATQLVEGVRMVHRQFLAALERLDVRPFESTGQPFNPELHEAIQQVERADLPPGSVAQELQRGYRQGDRVIRPALVVVSRAPAEPARDATGGGDEKRVD